MTGNSKEIKKLKYQQAKKREVIKRYKKRVRKHLLILSIPFVAYILLYIDSAFKEFGSVTKFLIIVISILALLAAAYLLSVRYMIQQREREIKIIRTKLYQLMKLEDD